MNAMQFNRLVNEARILSPYLFDQRQKKALELLEPNQEAFMQAMDYAVEHDPSKGVWMSSHLWRFWVIRGHLTESIEKLQSLMSEVRHSDNKAFSRGLIILGLLLYFNGRHEEGYELARGCMQVDDTLRGPWETGFCKLLSGWGAQHKKQYKEAESNFIESKELFKGLDFRWGEAASLLSLGEISRSLGTFEKAKSYYLQDLVIYEKIGDQSAIAASNCNLGFCAFHLDQLEEAFLYFSKALDICVELGNQLFGTGVFLGFSAIALKNERPEEAAILLFLANQTMEKLTSNFEPAETIEADRIRNELEKLVPVLAIDSLKEKAKSMDFQDGVRFIRNEILQD